MRRATRAEEEGRERSTGHVLEHERWVAVRAATDGGDAEHRADARVAQPAQQHLRRDGPGRGGVEDLDSEDGALPPRSVHGREAAAPNLAEEVQRREVVDLHLTVARLRRGLARVRWVRVAAACGAYLCSCR
jgi:hypothetical protein